MSSNDAIINKWRRVWSGILRLNEEEAAGRHEGGGGGKTEVERAGVKYTASFTKLSKQASKQTELSYIDIAALPLHAIQVISPRGLIYCVLLLLLLRLRLHLDLGVLYCKEGVCVRWQKNRGG